MLTWAGILSGALKLFNAIAAYLARKEAEASGAAKQRDLDYESENERISKADIAGDAVIHGGGVPVDQDPLNRDNPVKP